MPFSFDLDLALLHTDLELAPLSSCVFLPNFRFRVGPAVSLRFFTQFSYCSCRYGPTFINIIFLRCGHALLNQVPRHYNNCCTYHTSKYVPGALFVRIVRRWFTYTWYGITTIIRISRIWKNWNIESKGTRGGSAKICEIQQKANYQES